MRKNNQAIIGRWGEALAARFLRQKKYQIAACNVRSRFGEIDLIAENKKYLVFVEVKLRKDVSHGNAAEFVNTRKRERVKTTAMLWLQEHETKKQPRFDVIEIYAPEGLQTEHPVIRHIEDAFQ